MRVDKKEPFLQNEPPTPAAPRSGPRTKAGKARSSRNARKHGLTSPLSIIIEVIETPAAWQRYRDGIMENLAPQGALEEDLAESIALLRWRLKRVTHYETAILNFQVIETETDMRVARAYRAGTLSKGEYPEVSPDLVVAHQQRRVIPDDAEIGKITRYETHLHRLWLQTQHELEALQARRKGQPSHLARLDFSGPPVG